MGRPARTLSERVRLTALPMFWRRRALSELLPPVRAPARVRSNIFDCFVRCLGLSARRIPGAARQGHLAVLGQHSRLAGDMRPCPALLGPWGGEAAAVASRARDTQTPCRIPPVHGAACVRDGQPGSSLLATGPAFLAYITATPSTSWPAAGGDIGV